jgi:hypothetical protein
MDTTSSHPTNHPQPDGREIERMARDLVDSPGHFYRRGDQLEFCYSEGVLVVRGTAHSYYLKQLLQTALQRIVDGSCRIDIQVQVVSGPTTNGDAGRLPERADQ